jgi:hypothetical protein
MGLSHHSQAATASSSYRRQQQLHSGSSPRSTTTTIAHPDTALQTVTPQRWTAHDVRGTMMARPHHSLPEGEKRERETLGVRETERGSERMERGCRGVIIEAIAASEEEHEPAGSSVALSPRVRDAAAMLCSARWLSESLSLCSLCRRLSSPASSPPVLPAMAVRLSLRLLPAASHITAAVQSAASTT